MKMKKNILILSILIIITSCTANKTQQQTSKENTTTFRQALDSNIGKSASDLVDRLGPPDEEKSDYNGGKILIYKLEQTGYNKKSPKYIPNEKTPLAFKLDYSNSIETYKYDAIFMFWINKDNVIYKWTTKGIDVD